MRQFFLIAGIAAVSFFSYSQHRGLTLYSGADSPVQQSAGQRSPGGGSSISHK